MLWKKCDYGQLLWRMLWRFLFMSSFETCMCAALKRFPYFDVLPRICSKDSYGTQRYVCVVYTVRNHY